MALTLKHRIFFTTNVDTALSSSNPLEELYKISKAVALARCSVIEGQRNSKLSKHERKLMMNQMLLYTEQLNVISDLINSKNRNLDWSKELRFYETTTGLVKCRCEQNEISVGDHFPGNKVSLLTTKLSRQLRTVFLRALADGKPVLLHGRSGTGKIESCKDLARMLGKEHIINTCNENMSTCTAIKLLNQQLKKHHVIIFDEINLLKHATQKALIDATLSTAKCGAPLVIFFRFRCQI